jgi:alkylated DNA repair protein (DNA oxidative demethylase)
MMMDDLFAEDRRDSALGPGAIVLGGFATPFISDLLADLQAVINAAPLRHLVTPGGYRMSVAMTNCGALGWVADRSGYRYSATDPASGQPWPAMPASFLALARAAASEAGYKNFNPDACLVNHYTPGAKLSLHQDKDELDLAAPIVSVSLGLPAIFLFGGLNRADATRKILLCHGDVVVWGGPSRLAYHGVRPLKNGLHPQLGANRFNLTFRKTT